MPQLGLGISPVKNRSNVFYYDPDALSYLSAVEAADGQGLETGVKIAINNFVLDCKADGIWNSIVTSCIMAGARTVAGALVPLRGNAPTNNNFVAGDYSRTLGLIGDDSTKYLNTGYNNNDTTNFPQDDSHMSCYVTTSQTDAAGTLVGTTNSVGGQLSLHYNTTTNIICRNRASATSTLSLAPIGFQGQSRNNSSNFFRRFTSASGASDATVTATSLAPVNLLLGVFAVGTGTQFSNARMSFYSIGKSLSIPSLDTRVTTLMSAISEALA
jgi:hypothetical protein